VNAGLLDCCMSAPLKKKTKLAAAPTLGVSAPISLAGPDAHDLRETLALEQELREAPAAGEGATASADGAEVYERLVAITAQWVQAVGLRAGLSDEQVRDAGCALLPFGSYALLEELMPGSDLDLVAVVPYFVDRADFFAGGGLGGALLAHGAANLLAVEDAFVPVLKLSLGGVAVDLLLARAKASSSHEIVRGQPRPHTITVAHRHPPRQRSRKCRAARRSPTRFTSTRAASTSRTHSRSTAAWSRRRCCGSCRAPPPSARRCAPSSCGRGGGTSRASRSAWRS